MELLLSTRLLLIIAVVLLLLFVVSPFGYKLGILSLTPSLLIPVLAMAAGATVVLAGVIFLFGAINHGLAGDRNLLLLAIALSALPVIIMLPQVVKVRSVPAIHDISTDTGNPPAFVALLEAREASPNGARYGAAPNWPADKLARAQAAAYPDIQPIVSSLSPADAVARAEQVLVEMGLEIAEVDAEAGRLEATATTSWYGFKDDVVIRVSEHVQGSQLDLRSMSRIGRSDVGANAARIAEFTRLFSTS